MTFEEFRATGRDTDSIGEHVPGMDLEDIAGRVYLESLYIERWNDTWLLTLGNMQPDGPLIDLERLLYAWAMSAGY